MYWQVYLQIGIVQGFILSKAVSTYNSKTQGLRNCLKYKYPNSNSAASWGRKIFCWFRNANAWMPWAFQTILSQFLSINTYGLAIINVVYITRLEVNWLNFRKVLGMLITIYYIYIEFSPCSYSIENIFSPLPCIIYKDKERRKQPWNWNILRLTQEEEWQKHYHHNVVKHRQVKMLQYLLVSDTDNPQRAPAALSWRPGEAFEHERARET